MEHKYTRKKKFYKKPTKKSHGDQKHELIEKRECDGYEFLLYLNVKRESIKSTDPSFSKLRLLGATGRYHQIHLSKEALKDLIMFALQIGAKSKTSLREIFENE